jgi:hypothetical protein
MGALLDGQEAADPQEAMKTIFLEMRHRFEGSPREMPIVTVSPMSGYILMFLASYYQSSHSCP